MQKKAFQASCISDYFLSNTPVPEILDFSIYLHPSHFFAAIKRFLPLLERIFLQLPGALRGFLRYGMSA